MAYLDEKTGELVLTQDDREELKGMPKGWVERTMNQVIWGDKQDYYDNQK